MATGKHHSYLATGRQPRRGAWVTLIASTLALPSVALAGLIGAEVDATLEIASQPIFSGSAVVDDTAVPEFSGVTDLTNTDARNSSWTLDILEDGFVLESSCVEANDNGCLEFLVGEEVFLSIFNLNWVPDPGDVTGIDITEASQFNDPDLNPPPDEIQVDASVVSTSAVEVSFSVLQAGTVGGVIRVVGEFEVEKRPPEPMPAPAPLALLLFGAALLGTRLTRR